MLSSSHEAARSTQCRGSLRSKGTCQDINLTASLAQVKRGVLCQTSKSHHHVVSLVVIVMCLMLICMQTSKVQIQINDQIWSSCFWRFVILVLLILVGHFVTHFDTFYAFSKPISVSNNFQGQFRSAGVPP